MKKFLKYFTLGEWLLWGASVVLIVASFLIFGGSGYLTLCASLIGATSLIFNAKGNPAGQALMIVFSVLYGIISYGFAYYGEMLTYLCMTAPIALFAVISWLRHPYREGVSEVEVNTLSHSERIFAVCLTVAVTAAFYFILKYFNTANLIPSTVSVATSFLASYLTFRRSRFYAMWYAANDIVLIVLWTLATIEDISYLPMIICFVMFLANDSYGFFYWSKMLKRQSQDSK